MGLFSFFKKKSLSLEERKLNKLWELWEIGQAISPYQELMTYQAEVNNGGHSQFFFNVYNTEDMEVVVKEVLSILPEALSHNLQKAFHTYKKYNDVDDERMEDILEKCDDVFWENEEEINALLKEYADTMEV